MPSMSINSLWTAGGRPGVLTSAVTVGGTYKGTWRVDTGRAASLLVIWAHTRRVRMAGVREPGLTSYSLAVSFRRARRSSSESGLERTDMRPLRLVDFWVFLRYGAAWGSFVAS